MFKNLIVLAIAVFFILGCKSDASIKSELSSESDAAKTTTENIPVLIDSTTNLIKPDMEKLGKMRVVEVELEIPRMEDWKLLQEITIPGISPVGIGVHKDFIYLSDTSQSLVLKTSLLDSNVDTVMSDVKVVHISKRKGKLMLPIFNRDSMFVYRGEERDVYKFEVGEELNNPTSFDGYRIDDNYIVDQGNNRVVRNKNFNYSTFGSFGNGPNQFDKPSCIHIVGDKVHVTDTGNKRIQIFSLEGEFESEYGTKEGLRNPLAVSSDGKHVFICDSEVGAVFVYSNNGTLLYKLTEGIGKPRDLYFEDGKLYISDMEGAAVKIYTNLVYDNT